MISLSYKKERKRRYMMGIQMLEKSGGKSGRGGNRLKGKG
jgi:hypothetical protein